MKHSVFLDGFEKKSEMINIESRSGSEFGLKIQDDIWDLNSFRPDITKSVKGKTDAIVFYEGIKNTLIHDENIYHNIPRYILIKNKWFVNVR